MGSVRSYNDDPGEFVTTGVWREPTEEEWALIEKEECPWDKDTLPRFQNPFHQAWGQAKSSPEYNKSVWTDLDLALAQDSNDTIPALFHKAWGQAKASPEYDKSVWNHLDRTLFRPTSP